MDEGQRRWLERGLREAVLDGDDAAWQALYDAHFNRLYTHVYYRVGRNRQRAEEVVQDTWLRAVKRIRRFDPARGAFEQWLRGIADNVLRNAWRRWQRRDRTEIAMPAPVAAARPDGDWVVADQVALTMNALPAQYEAVLRAKYEEELAVSEIAERWEATPKAVESLLSRARAAFREAYGRLDAPCADRED